MSNQMEEKRCWCGFSTTNRGAWAQHKQKHSNRDPGRWEKLGERLDDMLIDGAMREDFGTKNALSRCCMAPQKYDKRKKVQVCSKCGLSPWEQKDR